MLLHPHPPPNTRTHTHTHTRTHAIVFLHTDLPPFLFSGLFVVCRARPGLGRWCTRRQRRRSSSPRSARRTRCVNTRFSLPASLPSRALDPHNTHAGLLTLLLLSQLQLCEQRALPVHMNCTHTHTHTHTHTIHILTHTYIHTHTTRRRHSTSCASPSRPTSTTASPSSTVAGVVVSWVPRQSTRWPCTRSRRHASSLPARERTDRLRHSRREERTSKHHLLPERDMLWSSYVVIAAARSVCTLVYELVSIVCSLVLSHMVLLEKETVRRYS
jgi:hypothetical protein